MHKCRHRHVQIYVYSHAHTAWHTRMYTHASLRVNRYFLHKGSLHPSRLLPLTPHPLPSVNMCRFWWLHPVWSYLSHALWLLPVGFFFSLGCPHGEHAPVVCKAGESADPVCQEWWDPGTHSPGFLLRPHWFSGDEPSKLLETEWPSDVWTPQSQGRLPALWPVGIHALTLKVQIQQPALYRPLPSPRGTPNYLSPQSPLAAWSWMQGRATRESPGFLVRRLKPRMTKKAHGEERPRQSPESKPTGLS